MASSSHIKPGEKGRIAVRLDVAQRSGTVVKTIEVLSNDPKKPRVVLTLKADVRLPAPPPAASKTE